MNMICQIWKVLSRKEHKPDVSYTSFLLIKRNGYLDRQNIAYFLHDKEP